MRRGAPPFPRGYFLWCARVTMTNPNYAPNASRVQAVALSLALLQTHTHTHTHTHTLGATGCITMLVQHLVLLDKLCLSEFSGRAAGHFSGVTSGLLLHCAWVTSVGAFAHRISMHHCQATTIWRDTPTASRGEIQRSCFEFVEWSDPCMRALHSPTHVQRNNRATTDSATVA